MKGWRRVFRVISAANALLAFAFVFQGMTDMAICAVVVSVLFALVAS